MEIEFNQNTFPKANNDIIIKYRNMKKLTRRYWNFAAYSFTYCLSYSIFHFLMHERLNVKWMILMSTVSCYFFSGFFKMLMIKKFNKRDYISFKTFCLKYQIVDEYI